MTARIEDSAPHTVNTNAHSTDTDFGADAVTSNPLTDLSS